MSTSRSKLTQNPDGSVTISATIPLDAPLPEHVTTDELEEYLSIAIANRWPEIVREAARRVAMGALANDPTWREL